MPFVRPAVLLAFFACACDQPSIYAPDAGDARTGHEEPVAQDGGQEEEAQRADGGAAETCAGLAVVDRGRPKEKEFAELPRCGLDRWWPAACRGSSLRLRLETRGVHLVVAALGWPDAAEHEPALASVSAAPGFPGEAIFTAPRSGEFRLDVRSLDSERESAYALLIECLTGCSQVCTRFPLVLVHGWTGFGNIGPIDYFYGVPEDLRALGFEVFVPVLDPYNSTEVRSEQLAARLEEVLAAGRARRANIIAHSQGGLDARRAISTLGFGDRVSALATFATPHHGTPIADIALGLLPGPAEEALAFLINLIGAAGGNESDALASFGSLTTAYLEETFNPENPDDPRVAYYSWTGICCPLGIGCGDICDVEIGWSHDIIYLEAGDNDGMVPVSSAPWGDFRGIVPADHFDEVGQLLGITSPNFDHLEFYRRLAAELAASGH